MAATRWEEAGRSPELSTKAPQTLPDLLSLSAAELGTCDIAMMNLRCAEALPGAEGMKPQDCLAALDMWAERVRSETARHLYRFTRNPAEFENSEGYFRMLMMAVVLYEDFSIRYDPKLISSPSQPATDGAFFADSQDLFLHGLCGERRVGTCSSMPVLYIAIGRRLGYPLKLVTTKSHLFLRWEDTKERFNLEATGRGMNRYDDEHFKQWPYKVSEEEIRADGYLESLSPAEELAVFLSLRGHCMRQAGRTAEAVAAYAAAARFAPQRRAYRLLLANAQELPTAGPASAQFLPPPPALAAPPQRAGPFSQSVQGPDPNPLRDVR